LVNPVHAKSVTLKSLGPGRKEIPIKWPCTHSERNKIEEKIAMGRFLYLNEWPYCWPTKCNFREFVYKSPENGFDKVYKKVNGRILIDEDAFIEWEKEQIEKKKTQKRKKKHDFGCVANYRR
jgi:hypothetical protein